MEALSEMNDIWKIKIISDEIIRLYGTFLLSILVFIIINFFFIKKWNNPHSSYYKSIPQSTGKLEKTNTHCRIIQEAAARNLASKAKKMLQGLRIWWKEIIEGSHRVNNWKTAEVTLTGSYKHHKTVTYFFKQLLFFPMSNCSFLKKDPTILQKKNFSPFLSLSGASLSSTRSE